MNDSSIIDAPEAEEPTSLYQRILNDIRGQIVSGAWPPGYRIPFEHELTVQYDCSRMTVNKALSQLANSGLIERRRRSGSFVRAPRGQAAVLEITDIRNEVDALGLPYSYTLSSRQERRSRLADAQLLGPQCPKKLLEMTCLHYAGQLAFCLEQRLISLDAVPDAVDESFQDLAPGPWLIRRVPWSTAEHRIRSEAAKPPVSTGLNVADGTPCLIVERRTWSADEPVTFARFNYPGELHSLVARFKPD
ncbi:MAG: histidine utilization repressor [Rhizobiaceae bacterium]|nr:histidine utilization repressor [Rhizobiaceae bacterium]